MGYIRFFDAHLDQFGPQSGGWGSAEQLGDMDMLSGALRVYFCERDGQAPQTVEDHLQEARQIDKLMRPYMPRRWKQGAAYRLHVEGLESARTNEDVDRLVIAFSQLGVRGFTPIYHKDNPLGGCSKESSVGLTELGRHAIERHTWLGAESWVDLAHMSHASMAETLGMQHVRICYTHGAIQHKQITDAVLTNGNLERCLNMELAKRIIAREGIICLSPARPFYPGLDGPFFDHLVELGEESAWRGVGIGTDYGGILDEWRFAECATVGRCFETVTEFLLQRNLHEAKVTAVVGRNVAEFFGLTA